MRKNESDESELFTRQILRGLAQRISLLTGQQTRSRTWSPKRRRTAALTSSSILVECELGQAKQVRADVLGLVFQRE